MTELATSADVLSGADGVVDSLAAADVAAADAVVVRLGAGRFALALERVAEVGRVPAVTRVPGTPGWLRGVANWRGRVLPVLDLRSLLGADTAALGPRGRLVVLTTDAGGIGLLADAVEGTTVLGSEVAPFPAALPDAGPGLVCGQLPREDGPIAVLDVAAITGLRETLPRGRRSA